MTRIVVNMSLAALVVAAIPGCYIENPQARNPALPIAGLSIRYSDAGWEALEMDGWNHFPVSDDLGSGPFDFLVTAIDGQELLEEGVPYEPGGVVQGSGQFAVSL